MPDHNILCLACLRVLKATPWPEVGRRGQESPQPVLEALAMIQWSSTQQGKPMSTTFARHQSGSYINVLIRVSDDLVENHLTDSEKDDTLQCIGDIQRRGNDWFSTEFAAVVHTGEFDAQKIADGMSALLVEQELFDVGEKFELV